MLKRLLKQHEIIALDTQILIYHFENHPKYSGLTSEILKAVQTGSCRCIVSEISLLEILVHPLRLDRQDIADKYEILLTNFPNLMLAPVTRNIILKAASIRAATNLKSPDSLILATAIDHDATLAITNDISWKKITKLRIACLEDYMEVNN